MPRNNVYKKPRVKIFHGVKDIALYDKSCYFFLDDGFIGEAIVDAQDLYWEEFGLKSQWSHIGFVGIDGIFYESTVRKRVTYSTISAFGLTINIPKVKFIYGVTSMPKERRFKGWWKHYKQIGVQYDFKDLNDGDWRCITNYAKRLIANHTKYGGFELFGTLATLLEWKATKDPDKRSKILRSKNPVNTSNVYCIATVADSFKNDCGIDYISPDIDSSISTVDHGWYTNLKHKSIIYYRD